MDRREFLAVSAAGMAACAIPVIGAPPAGLVFSQDPEESARLASGFSRNPDFPLNRYAQICPTTKKAGKYLRASLVTEQDRLNLAAQEAGFCFDGGPVTPRRNEGFESFEFCDYETERFRYGWKIEPETIAKAEWDIRKHTASLYAQQAMTGRTKKAVAQLVDPASYLPGFSADVKLIDGNAGSWAASIDTRQDMRRSIQCAVRMMHEATKGALSINDLRLVFNPVSAERIGESDEMVTYMKAVKETGRPDGRYTKRYRLPDHYAGIEIVVEDSVCIASSQGLDCRSYVMPTGVAALVARPGGIEAHEGPTYSFLTLIADQDMRVERATDPATGDVHGGIVDAFSAVVTSPVTGFLFKGIA